MTLQRRGLGVRTQTEEQVKYQIWFISKGPIQVYCQGALKEKRLPNPIDDKLLGSVVEEFFSIEISIWACAVWKWAGDAELGLAAVSKTILYCIMM